MLRNPRSTKTAGTAGADVKVQATAAPLLTRAATAPASSGAGAGAGAGQSVSLFGARRLIHLKELPCDDSAEIWPQRPSSAASTGTGTRIKSPLCGKGGKSARVLSRSFHSVTPPPPPVRAASAPVGLTGETPKSPGSRK
jgi:hypothetical protein